MAVRIGDLDLRELGAEKQEETSNSSPVHVDTFGFPVYTMHAAGRGWGST